MPEPTITTPQDDKNQLVLSALKKPHTISRENRFGEAKQESSSWELYFRVPIQQSPQQTMGELKKDLGTY